MSGYLKLLAGILFIFFHPTLFAATASTTFQVMANVVNGCDFTLATDLNFGNYFSSNPAATTGNSNITVQCVNAGINYSIALSAGNSGDITDRYMLNGTNQLHYNLYQDPTFTILWGDGVTGLTEAGVSTGGADTYTVYGRITPLQAVANGLYTDTITATLNF